MDQPLSSKALEANLAQTRIEDITIPVEHQRFIDLSVSHWGIHKTAQDLMKEHHHPYSNRQFVVDHLRQILLRDLWFYNSLPEPEKAFAILIEIADRLLLSDAADESKEKIIQTLLEFAGNLSRQEKIPKSTLDQCLKILREQSETNELITIHNSRYFKTYLADTGQLPGFFQEVFDLTRDILEKCIRFWEDTSNTEAWYEEKQPFFQHDYREKISHLGAPFFSEMHRQLEQAQEWDALAEIPSFDDIANHFRRFIDEFEIAPEKIYFIVHLLDTPGMHHLKDNLLWDIDRLLRNVHQQLNAKQFSDFSEKLMDLFEELKTDYMPTVLDCLLTLGKEVVDTENQQLISTYQKRLIGFGFVTPGAISVSKDWQVQVDVNHIKNIRMWLELIEYSPTAMAPLLSALIVNLRLGGIFVADTDLFQRDVTKLLNADIAPVFKQIKALARIFPVYFSEIGAEGELRDVTTAIDELCQRRDRIIHFLRKQTHTESNSTHIALTEKIMQFWFDGQLDPLWKVAPQDVMESIDLKSEWFIPIHEMVQWLVRQCGCSPRRLLEMGDQALEAMFSGFDTEAPTYDRDKKRLLHLARIHALLSEKYSFHSGNIVPILSKSRLLPEEESDRLAELLAGDDIEATLKHVYRLLGQLNQTILDPKYSEGWENIYRKRHLAAGIPSMYGEYHERKFEALGLVFRLEKIAARLIEQMTGDINLEYITARRLRRISNVLTRFQEGLALAGINSQGFNSNLEMLEYSFTSGSCSLEQYVNIFEFLQQNVKDIINEYFLRPYEQPLRIIIPQIDGDGKTASEADKRETLHKKSEEFYRELLSASFLTQDLDNFVSDTLNALRNTVDHYSPHVIGNMMTFAPDLMISPLCEETPKMDNQLFLGAKAYFLKKLYSLGFPVPPGFVLTTEFFRHKTAILEHPEIGKEMEDLIKAHIANLEKITDQRFGDPDNPLLLSVRSGTAISMPGAIVTLLNTGLNDEIAAKLSARPGLGWTAWDCYRRFLQSWGSTHGMDRDIFDAINYRYESQYQVQKGTEFTADQMKEIAYEYKRALHDHGIHFEDDPYLQLRQSVLHVIDSWDSERVKVYRSHMEIAGEWGTAVLIQKMVLGNLGPDSGTGAMFTHDPHEGKPGINIYGDFTLCSQGEDIVTGWVHTLPVTEYHRLKYHLDNSISLESAFPQIYERLIDLSTQLIEKHGYGPQEIEFTSESARAEDLYILQTRRQDIRTHDKRWVFDVSHDQLQLVGRGIGIGGGALNGILAFDMEDLEQLSEDSPGEKRILVRPDTVPDDIGMIFNCDGLVTGKGGATSHAAVTAARLGKVCVVGCKNLQVDEEKKTCTIDGIVFKTGDQIAIDGHLGNIYKGHYPIDLIDVN